MLSLPCCSKCYIFLAAKRVLTLFILMFTTSCWLALRSSLRVSRDFSVIGLKLMSITYKRFKTFSSLNNSMAPSSVMPHCCNLSSWSWSHREAAAATILAPWSWINVSLMSIDNSLFSMHSFRYVSISPKNSASTSSPGAVCPVSSGSGFYGWIVGSAILPPNI